MKLLLALILSLPAIASAQWRAVAVSSPTDTQAIQENFRRASVYSNRKLDRFSNDTMYGKLTLKDDLVLEDGSTLTSTAPYAALAGTQTFTGANNFSSATSTTAFSGWIDIGLNTQVYTGSGSNARAACAAGYRVIGGGCSIGTEYVMHSYPSTETTEDAAVGTPVADGGVGYSWSCRVTASVAVVAYAICARIK